MIYRINGKEPSIHESCFIANSADIVGDVILEENTSVWFGAVVRGDTNTIHIGKGTNIQDKCAIHVNEDGKPVEVGEYVTVGHGVILHGCNIGNHTVVGMGSIILDNAEIGEYTMIGAGSLVTANKKIPSGVLCMGSPAKVIRELTEEEKASLKKSAEHYTEMADRFK